MSEILRGDRKYFTIMRGNFFTREDWDEIRKQAAQSLEEQSPAEVVLEEPSEKMEQI